MPKVINGDARNMNLAVFDQYQTIVADPPWHYSDRKCGSTKFGPGTPYDYLTKDDMTGIPVCQLAALRCHLYLWATMPKLPVALEVMESWGFRYATVAFVWVKCNPGRWREAKMEVLQAEILDRADDHIVAFLDQLAFFGPGFYTASNAELVLLGIRGRPFYHADKCKAAQIIFAPRGKHSQKPERVQDLIEAMYPDATPRLELFARRPRDGWTVFGNEVTADG